MVNGVTSLRDGVVHHHAHVGDGCGREVCGGVARPGGAGAQIDGERLLGMGGAGRPAGLRVFVGGEIRGESICRIRRGGGDPGTGGEVVRDVEAGGAANLLGGERAVGDAQLAPDIDKLAISKQCFACHQVDKTSVGPAYLDVAMKYRDQPDAAARLQAKLKTGGSGGWGEVPMPPQPATSDAERETLVRALLNLAQGMAETRGTATGQLTLPAAPDTPQPGGAWEITAESPGHTAALLRLAAE